MRNIKWLRYGLASTVLACGALGAFLVACGDDDSGVTATDAGNDNNVTPTDSGGGDTGTKDSGNDAGGPVPAKIILVHGATDYGPNNPTGIVRVCYATKTDTDTDFVLTPLDPLPHSKAADSQLPFPGIPIGTGGPFPSTGIPLEGFAIRPYIISAQALAERGVTGKDALTPKCNQLLKAGGFVPDGGFAGNDAAPALAENTDYWKLGDIPKGTFKNGKTYLLSVTGCTSDVNGANFGATGKCGPDPAGDGGTPYQPTGTAGTGNLKIAVLEIDATSTVAADEMGVQVVHLSPQYQIGRTISGGTTIRPFQPVFGSPFSQAVTPDAGYDAGSTVKVGSSEISFNPNGSITALAKLKGIVTTTGYFAANESQAAAEGPFIPIALNNAGFPVDAGAGVVTIQYLSEGQAVPNQTPLYTNGKAYTFVLVGDPQGTSTRKIHFLAFPNQFTPPKSSD